MSSDPELVRAILLGDPAAPRVLLLRYLDTLRRDARAHDWQLPPDTDVDDVLQAFGEKLCANGFRALALWKGLNEPGACIEPYFRTILRNLLHDFGRRRQGEPEDPLDEDPTLEHLMSDDDPEAEVGNAQLRAAVGLCIATALKPTQRRVIAMHLADRAHADIATAIGMSVANSRVILNRALAALKACLEARLRNVRRDGTVVE